MRGALHEPPPTRQKALRSQFSTFRLVIECKRNKAQDARQLRWVFLLPDQELKQTRLASCFEVETYQNQQNLSDFERIKIWDQVSLAPDSLQSEFCIFSNDEAKKTPLLETMCAEVLESVEGIADEEISIAYSQNSKNVRLYIFPAIVTKDIIVDNVEPRQGG